MSNDLFMDDGGYSSDLYNKNNLTKNEVSNLELNQSINNLLDSTYHANGLFKRNEINLFKNDYRFGIVNPYESLTTTKEYVFFTKPDLNIYPLDNTTGIPDDKLSEYLYNQSYWRELESKYPEIIECLQHSKSSNKDDPFNHLLFNTRQSHLELPSLNSDTIDVPTNMYGVGYTYHGSSEASDDNFEFSLEFKDTKYLPVYHFFRAYEEYQTYKHHGLLPPYFEYVKNKILYDHYSIYKFLVDEDGETVIYYAKLYGVKSKSLPRDTFNDTVFDDGISYTIDFTAAFFEDMKPHILEEFNSITENYYNSLRYDIDIHNHVLDQADNRPAKCPHIIKTSSINAPGKSVYKLKWRGDDRF